MDHEEDFESFLNSDEALRRLAKADALGIARYLGLENKKTGIIPEPLRNYEEKLVTFKENYQTEEATKVFYTDSSFTQPLYGRELDFFTLDLYHDWFLKPDRYDRIKGIG
jgi:hypothetical protein